MVHDPRSPCEGNEGGRSLGPVSGRTRRRAAARPVPADTESLTQHGPAVGEGQRGRIARAGNLRDPLLVYDWRHKGPYTVTVSPLSGRRPVNPRRTEER